MSRDFEPELTSVEELPEEGEREPVLRDSPEQASWRKEHLEGIVPSVFLDAKLRIVEANRSFCRLFATDDTLAGTYLTKFFALHFDEARSAELFRAVLSPATGFTWTGRAERLGGDQLLNVSKLWVLPLMAAGAPSPKAYFALCLDMTLEYRRFLRGTYLSLLEAARLKDNDTGSHVERVNRYSRILAQDLADCPASPPVARQFIESIGTVASLHDIGKIGTPDDILNKVGQFEAWERSVMKQHTTNGAYILANYHDPMASEIALRHHERWDGKGYPHELAGELIPLSGRIVAIADVYDALRMRRVYKEAYSHEKAVQSIVEEKGTHFDPFLVDRFLVVAEKFGAVFSELADSP